MMSSCKPDHTILQQIQEISQKIEWLLVKWYIGVAKSYGKVQIQFKAIAVDKAKRDCHEKWQTGHWEIAMYFKFSFESYRNGSTV